MAKIWHSSGFFRTDDMLISETNVLGLSLTSSLSKMSITSEENLEQCHILSQMASPTYLTLLRSERWSYHQAYLSQYNTRLPSKEK